MTSFEPCGKSTDRVESGGRTTCKVESLARPKLRSIRFVRKMFADRGYRVDDESMKTMFDSKQDLWQIFTTTKSGEKVVAIFAGCKAFGDSLEVDDEDLSQFTRVDATEIKSSLNIPSAKSGKNTGTDYIKSILKFARDQDIKVVILVTDFMTPQAAKLMMKVDGMRMTHFKYDETGIEHMSDHITQPIQFKALTGKARKEFIAKNPRYQIELLRYSFDDALVKYYGMKIGDIIHIVDNDRQSALVEEYGIVVEEI